METKVKPLSNLLETFPRLRDLTDRVYYVNFLFWKLKAHTRDYGKKLDMIEISINPRMIRHQSLKKFNTNEDVEAIGKVLPGNWDLRMRKIEDSKELRPLLARHTKTVETRDKESGYELSFAKETSGSEANHLSQWEEKVTVSIGRKGDIVVNSGLNDLIMAELSGSESIRARIFARHSKWQEFRKEMYSLALEGRLYQPLTHPDLSYFPAEHASEDRLTMVKANLTTQKGRLLDIGTNLGYFCHKFEELGFDCYGVENDLRNIYFLKKLKRAENRRFTIITGSILDWKDISKMDFDVVLALNIFHHFLKKRATYLKLTDLLGKLKTNELFFEPHCHNDPQMRSAYRNYSEDEFVEFILNNSRLKNAKKIGLARDGRPIFKLY